MSVTWMKRQKKENVLDSVQAKGKIWSDCEAGVKRRQQIKEGTERFGSPCILTSLSPSIAAVIPRSRSRWGEKSGGSQMKGN